MRGTARRCVAGKETSSERSWLRAAPKPKRNAQEEPFTDGRSTKRITLELSGAEGVRLNDWLERDLAVVAP
jgi:hypothetical protein